MFKRLLNRVVDSQDGAVCLRYDFSPNDGKTAGFGKGCSKKKILILALDLEGMFLSKRDNPILLVKLELLFVARIQVSANQIGVPAVEIN